MKTGGSCSGLCMACAHKGTCKHDCTAPPHTKVRLCFIFFIFLKNLPMVFFSSRVKAGPHHILRPFSVDFDSISLGFSGTLFSLGFYLMLKHMPVLPLGPSSIYPIFFLRTQSTWRGGIPCVLPLLLHLWHIELRPAEYAK